LNIYPDTSFLVSLYLADRHSAKAELLSRSNPPFYVTPLHSAEWTHAIEQHVFRGTISEEHAQRLHSSFASDCNEAWTQLSIPDRAFERCAVLARRYVAKIGVRTLDTLHVAAALELNIGLFWTFDERQTKLAQAVGLKTN
jgi:predicted nucleic acid-binding protein